MDEPGLPWPLHVPVLFLPWQWHSQGQPVLHGVEPVEALPVDQPVHGVVVDLQERLQGAAGWEAAGQGGLAVPPRAGLEEWEPWGDTHRLKGSCTAMSLCSAE